MDDSQRIEISRRTALMSAAAAWATVSVVPAHAAGRSRQISPNGKQSLAGVGVGGVGFGQLQELEKAGFQITALCDVDDAYAKKAFDRWPQARKYRDFREMLRVEGDRIDAVYCGTPDHNHAIVVMAALRGKKNICCVKPLTRSIHESRALLKAARAAGVATQMTAAPNTSETACRTCEYVQGGLIGPVREVHIWSNRPVWPQGMERPAGADPIPSTFDWKLWVGPAPDRPFKDKWPEGHTALSQMKNPPDWVKGNRGVYHPFNFRGWWDFGAGALGDMGCHHFNTVFRALKLGAPTAVSATSTNILPESAPLASIVTYEFPARESLPPVRLVWYDGGLQPPRPVEMGSEPFAEEGTLYIGEQGKLLSTNSLRILPRALTVKADTIPKTLPRRGGTWAEWHEACKGGPAAGCHFDWAVPLTEIVLLGNIALRVQKPLAWDGAAGRFTNSDAATGLVEVPYHNGWSLDAV